MDRLSAEAREAYGLDLSRCVRQFHADLTLTAEHARARYLPSSIRAADFWHTLERIKECLASTLSVQDDDGTATYFNEILQWVHMTRTQCVTFTEQHVLWSLLLRHYGAIEPATAESLRKYFLTVPVEQARDVYGVVDPIFCHEGKMLCALFWCGLQRLQPGSACGSQPCESQHKTWLQPLLQTPDGKPLRNATPPTLFPALRRAIRTISRQYTKMTRIPSRPTAMILR